MNWKSKDQMQRRLYVGADDSNYLESVEENTTNLGKIFDKESKAKELNADLDKK